MGLGRDERSSFRVWHAEAAAEPKHAPPKRSTDAATNIDVASDDGRTTEQSQLLRVSGANETGAIFIVCEHTTKKLITAAARPKRTAATTR